METKKETIIRHIRQYDRGYYSLDEVADDILLLFDVVKPVCVHYGEIDGNVIRCTKCKIALSLYEQPDL